MIYSRSKNRAIRWPKKSACRSPPLQKGFLKSFPVESLEVLEHTGQVADLTYAARMPPEIGIWSAGRTALSNFYLAVASASFGRLILALLLARIAGSSLVLLPQYCWPGRTASLLPLFENASDTGRFSADFFKKTEGLHNCKEDRRSAACVMWLPSLQHRTELQRKTALQHKHCIGCRVCARAICTESLINEILRTTVECVLIGDGLCAFDTGRP